MLQNRHLELRCSVDVHAGIEQELEDTRIARIDGSFRCKLAIYALEFHASFYEQLHDIEALAFDCPINR